MKEVSYRDLSFNPMTMIGDEWCLLTAGNESSFNTMTVSWAHLGSIWGHGRLCPTCIVYARPQRYTKEFLDREDLFTLSVYPSSFKKDLAYLGSRSGRDEDKLAHTSLTPVFTDGTVTFREARLTFVCRKLYVDDIKEECFVDASIPENCYPEKDYHTFYVGEIIKCYTGE